MWYFQGKPVQSIQDLESGTPIIGFCYMITNLQTGKIYIGKKQLRSTKRKIISAKQRALTKTRKKITTVSTESN